MEKTAEERINEISESVTQISLSVAKLWEICSGGQRPHKITLNMMTAILTTSVLSLVLGVFIAIEIYLLLEKVHSIYSLMI